MRIDNTDRKLLALLMEDGRQSYASLGQQVGLSTAATKRRVDRLRQDRIIRGFGADVDPTALGWNIEAFVEIYCNGQIPPEQMKEFAAAIPEVYDGYTVTGEADGLLVVRCTDAGHLERVLGEIRTHHDVVRTRSAIVLSHL
ncbi:Lrp/AsnC family transcriptional regulator [Microlunatus soli]|uniref:DNA-binding transcriptional regulator, Lrp family n=1 Tax=Microlunatus soli TaxID=630515 RepID=A0A1H1WKV0_9ACTN|nr:Lrp/AsnC family transcriptional regulator [Microlunatus soli]SDS97632.1 DNA-binding transcriptional regulator, Lrp family [Microlunatus soli]